MKKYNWNIGIPFSFLIAIIASLPRLIRLDDSAVPQYMYLAAYYFIFSLLTWYINSLIVNATFLNRYGKSTLVYFLVTALSGIVLALAFDEFNSIITGTPLQHTDIPEESRRLMLILFRGLLFNCLNAFFVFHLRHMKDKQQKLLELEYLKQAQLEAKLSSLKEQLSPHFLFNTLNTLSTLTHEAEVKTFVNELAELYRYILKNRLADYVTLKQEVDFMSSYLYILNTRLGQSLQIKLEVSEQYYQSRIPPLVLQLLVENALKHNIALQSKPLVLQISTTGQDIIVENNLQVKKTNDQVSGIGLANINDRYKLLFGKEISIEQTDNNFRVKLPLIV